MNLIRERKVKNFFQNSQSCSVATIVGCEVQGGEEEKKN